MFNVGLVCRPKTSRDAFKAFRDRSVSGHRQLRESVENGGGMPYAARAPALAADPRPSSKLNDQLPADPHFVQVRA